MSKKKERAKKRILITGGHMTPAQAVTKVLKRRGYKDIYWIGHKFSMEGDKNTSAEYKMVRDELNINFVELKAGKIYRKWTKQNFVDGIINLIRIPISFFKTFIFILNKRPHIVISFGGYIALPVVIISRLMLIEVVTHEQTVVTGLANKVIGKLSNKIFISWEQSRRYFSHKKVIFTGNPYRKEVIRAKTKIYKFKNDLPTIYITGGNQGSHVINLVVSRVLPEILCKFNVIHQCGRNSITNDYRMLKKLKKSLDENIQDRYIPKDFIFSNEIGEVFSKADLIISRSGANISTDILVVGKLAILIPIPWSSYDEQYKNAIYLRDLGIARILLEKDLSNKTLLEEINVAKNFIKNGSDFNRNPLKTLKKRMEQYINPDAERLIVDEVEQIILKS